MKNLLVVAILLALIGCAANHSWEGFTDREVMRWQALSVDEYEAQKYMKNGLTAMDVERWREQGFIEQGDIIKWSKSQFNAYEAANWHSRGFETEDARAWAQENFSALEASQWKQKGFTLTQAVTERAKGLEPENDM
jgi:hypothetical protein